MVGRWWIEPAGDDEPSDLGIVEAEALAVDHGGVFAGKGRRPTARRVGARTGERRSFEEQRLRAGLLHGNEKAAGHEMPVGGLQPGVQQASRGHSADRPIGATPSPCEVTTTSAPARSPSSVLFASSSDGSRTTMVLPALRYAWCRLVPSAAKGVCCRPRPPSGGSMRTISAPRSPRTRVVKTPYPSLVSTMRTQSSKRTPSSDLGRASWSGTPRSYEPTTGRSESRSVTTPRHDSLAVGRVERIHADPSSRPSAHRRHVHRRRRRLLSAP
jgi:hypothetical protein